MESGALLSFFCSIFFIFIFSFLIPFFALSRGAMQCKLQAEIIPVEPEQGNACEGKVNTFL